MELKVTFITRLLIVLFFQEGRVKYKANGTFSNTSPNNPGITDFKLNELDFNILGFLL